MEAFLIIDLQNDFCPGGALPVPGGHDIVPLVNGLMARFEHVLLTQDWHPPGHLSFASSHPGRAPYERVEAPYGAQILWPDHCVQGTPGAAFHFDLEANRAQLVLRKGFRAAIDSYSAFFENDRKTPTGLAGYLREREIDTLYLAGLAADFCVNWSALDARRQGLAVYVIEDAVRGIDVGNSLALAWEGMREAGVRILRSPEVPGA